MTYAEEEQEAIRRAGQGPTPSTENQSYGVPTPPPPPPLPQVSGTKQDPTFQTGGYANIAVQNGYAPVPSPVVPRRVAPLASQPQSIQALPPPPPTVNTGTAATQDIETPEMKSARELQARAAQGAVDILTGKTIDPSLYAIDRGVSQGIAQQQSQAAGARGMAVSAARRQAGRQIGDLQQGAIGQKAEATAISMDKARNTLAGIAGNMRAQDIQTTTLGMDTKQRAEKLSQDFTIAMGDLELREKLGLLSDERERNHLDEMRRSNKAIEDLKARGLNIEAQRLKDEMDMRNKEFWGGLIANLGGTIGKAAAGGG